MGLLSKQGRPVFNCACVNWLFLCLGSWRSMVEFWDFMFVVTMDYEYSFIQIYYLYGRPVTKQPLERSIESSPDQRTVF